MNHLIGGRVLRGRQREKNLSDRCMSYLERHSYCSNRCSTKSRAIAVATIAAAAESIKQAAVGVYLKCIYNFYKHIFHTYVRIRIIDSMYFRGCVLKLTCRIKSTTR